MERNSETPRVVPFVFKGLLVLHWDLEVQERPLKSDHKKLHSHFSTNKQILDHNIII